VELEKRQKITNNNYNKQMFRDKEAKKKLLTNRLYVYVLNETAAKERRAAQKVLQK
jgi:hypothetical protein